MGVWENLLASTQEQNAILDRAVEQGMQALAIGDQMYGRERDYTFGSYEDIYGGMANLANLSENMRQWDQDYPRQISYKDKDYLHSLGFEEFKNNLALVLSDFNMYADIMKGQSDADNRANEILMGAISKLVNDKYTASLEKSIINEQAKAGAWSAQKGWGPNNPRTHTEYSPNPALFGGQ